MQRTGRCKPGNDRAEFGRLQHGGGATGKAGAVARGAGRFFSPLWIEGPKLLAERRAGARAVLILENDDGALSNPIEIGAALQAELAGSEFTIDEVYLIDTDRAADWLMKQGARWWPQRYESPRSWEFSPDALRDILTG
jgi:hypothetical protein